MQLVSSGPQSDLLDYLLLAVKKQKNKKGIGAVGWGGVGVLNLPSHWIPSPSIELVKTPFGMPVDLFQL